MSKFEMAFKRGKKKKGKPIERITISFYEEDKDLFDKLEKVKNATNRLKKEEEAEIKAREIFLYSLGLIDESHSEKIKKSTLSKEDLLYLEYLKHIENTKEDISLRDYMFGRMGSVN